MKKFINLSVLLLMFMLLLPSFASGDTMKWRYYSYVTKRIVMPVGFAKAPANGIFERRGVAQFDNGELALVHMKGAGKFSPTGAKLEGFGHYTFMKDGSTKVFKWQVTGKREDEKKPVIVSGKGQYISGTGRFKGIKGDVTINGKHLTPYSKEKGTMGDMVVDLTANYTLPAK